MKEDKQALFQTSILTNPHLGLYTITTYYDDCTHDKHIAPLGPIIQPTYLIPRGSDVELAHEAPSFAGWVMIALVVVGLLGAWFYGLAILLAK